MNQTQKTAIITLFGAIAFLTTLAFGITFGLFYSGPKRLCLLIAVAYITGLGLLFVFFTVFLRGKQSPVEPDFDERDVIINLKAGLYSHIATWLIFAVLYIVSTILMGLEASVPLFALGIALPAILALATAIYCAAILIQYRWGRKHGE